MHTQGYKITRMAVAAGLLAIAQAATAGSMADGGKTMAPSDTTVKESMVKEPMDGKATMEKEGMMKDGMAKESMSDKAMMEKSGKM